MYRCGSFAPSTEETFLTLLSFLMAQLFTAFACILAWVSGSMPIPASKRAVALAFINCFAQLGNVFAMLVNVKFQVPFHLSDFGCMICQVCVVILVGSKLSDILCFLPWLDCYLRFHVLHLPQRADFSQP